jgi:DNA-binding NtrC family response regulator
MSAAAVALNPKHKFVAQPRAEDAAFLGMIGTSPQMRDVFSRIEKIAPYYRSVLITGETGTGKELAARAMHDLSPARDGHFVTLNCSAVVETLFESELFGHVRGSFTGANSDKMGLFEYANGGTLFLDEIGDMPQATQAKLLRVLQNQEVSRVGSLTPRKVNVRVVAATNKDLREAVRRKEFREDLYYRISMVEVALPPLRSRVGDLRRLLDHALSASCTRYRRPGLKFAPEVMSRLVAHSWPGNVRELENVVGHACMMAQGEVIRVEDLPASLQANSLPVCVPGLGGNGSDALQESESFLLRQALEQTGQNQARAARLLRTSRDRLRYKMKKYGLLMKTPEPVCA